MAQKEKSRAIIVLGMHRSGTSLVARGLYALDVEMGNSLLQPLHDNPKGFWEDKEIVRINDALLAIHGRKWDSIEWDEISKYAGRKYEKLRKAARSHIQDNYISSKLWGFKDPRTVRLLGFWRVRSWTCGC